LPDWLPENDEELGEGRFSHRLSAAGGEVRGKKKKKGTPSADNLD